MCGTQLTSACARAQQTTTFIEALQHVDIPAKQVRAMSVPLQDAFVAAVHSIEATADLLRDFIILWQPVLTKKEKPSQAALASFEVRDDLSDEQRSAVGAFHAYATELSMNNLQTLLVEHKGMVSVGAAAVLAGVIALVMSRGGENDPSVVSKEKKTPSPVVRTPVPPATSPVVVPPAPRDTKAIEAAFDRFFAKRRHIKAFKRFFDERGRVTSDPLLDATAIGALSAELQAEVRRYVNDFNAQMADAEKRVGVRSKRGQRVTARLLFEEIVTAHHDTPVPDDTPAAQEKYFGTLNGWCTQLSDMLIVLDPDDVMSAPLVVAEGKKVMRTAQEGDVVPRVRELLATITTSRDAMAEKLPELKKKQWLDGDAYRTQSLATQSDIDVLRGMVFQEPPADAGVAAEIAAVRRAEFESARQQRIAAIDYAQNSWMAKIEAAMAQIGGAATMQGLERLVLPTPDDVLTEDGKISNPIALTGKETLVAALRGKMKEVQEGRVAGVRADLEAASATLEQLVDGDVAVRIEAAQVQVQEAEKALLTAQGFAHDKRKLFDKEQAKRDKVDDVLRPLQEKKRGLQFQISEQQQIIRENQGYLVEWCKEQQAAQKQLNEAKARLEDIKVGRGNWDEPHFLKQKIAAMKLLNGDWECKHRPKQAYACCKMGYKQRVETAEKRICDAQKEQQRLEAECAEVVEEIAPLTQQREDEAPAYDSAERAAKQAGAIVKSCVAVVRAAQEGVTKAEEEVASAAIERILAPDWEQKQIGVSKRLLAEAGFDSLDALAAGTKEVQGDVADFTAKYKKQVVQPWLDKLTAVRGQVVTALERHYAAFAAANNTEYERYNDAGGQVGGAVFNYTQVNRHAKAIMGCDLGDASWEYLAETSAIDGPEVSAFRRLVKSLDALGLSCQKNGDAFEALVGFDEINTVVSEWRTGYKAAVAAIAGKHNYQPPADPDAISVGSAESSESDEDMDEEESESEGD